jgi:EF-P beta-lysylation protein EpmB
MSETNRATSDTPRPTQRHGVTMTPWRVVLKEAVRDLDTLAEILQLPATDLAGLADASNPFPLLVPRPFIARMKKGDIHDPLLLQVMPRIAESVMAPGFSEDPLEERPLAESGVIQKYHGRVLLIASGACPIHCRYCFRRHFPYSAQLAARAHWRDAVDALRVSPETSEVILSGGDPLSLSTAKLIDLIEQLADIPHVARLRIHTRYPIVIPERIDGELLAALSASPLQTIVVVHANHPNEIDAAVEDALRRLARACNALLNQSVLLREVNDSVAALCELSQRLFSARVMPYYLHLLDRVQGSAHFDVDMSTALALMDGVRTMLPGYLVPKLVRETPGALSKVVVQKPADDENKL